MTRHAVRSPSSAHRWTRCFGANEMSEGMPNETSAAAEDGILAHAWAAWALNGEHGIEPKIPDEWREQLHGYVERCFIMKVTASYSAVEGAMPIGAWTLEDKAHGTADFSALAGNRLIVRDLKFGTEIVSANNDDPAIPYNPQLVLYALGAWSLLESFCQIDEVELCIDQPRREHLESVVIPIAELLAIGDVIRNRAAANIPGVHLTPGTKQCKYCPARGKCSARAEWVKVNFLRQIDTLSDADIGQTLTQADDLTSWLADLKTEAMRRNTIGRKIPGWKVVTANTKRRWGEGADDALREQLGDQLMYKPRELVNLGDAEKFLGKKHEVFSRCLVIIKPDGGPTLAPESDKRPALSLAPDAFTASVTEKEE